MVEKLQKIVEERVDLSDYLIHFISDSDTKISFDILLNIIEDGYLKCGWAIKYFKRTVFGKMPAVCFTEMPLFAYFDYVNKREDPKKITNYGIALFKQDLFIKGARNVIYGLTDYSKEEIDSEGNGFIQGFPERELYRYMLTDIKSKNDWTHEREWRWIDSKDLVKNNNCLPLWTYQEKRLSKKIYTEFEWRIILIIVEHENEVKIVKDLLLSKIKNPDYISHNITNTAIICKETIQNSKVLPEYYGFKDVMRMKLFEMIK